MATTSRKELSDDEIKAGLNSVIKDGLASQAMVTLTGGIFLVAFALKLGASNFIIGLLAAIPPLTQLIQLPAIKLIQKYKSRRTISVYASLSSRIFLLIIALIPFLFSLKIGLVFLIIAVILNSAIGAIGGCSWNSWMRDLVPEDKLGVFFSKRMSLAIALGLVLSLTAGFFIDYWEMNYPAYELYGYSILFIAGFIAGLIGVYFITTIPEPEIIQEVSEQSIVKEISKPFKDDNFSKLLKFLGSWNFAINLAAPFFTVYMLLRLDLDMSYIIVFLVLSQIFNFFFLRIWGRFTDKYTNKSVLGICTPMFIFSILLWTFTTMPDKHIFTIPLLVIIHVLMGISLAGVTLATGNIALKLAPKGQATTYLATSTVINSIAAGFAPIIGGLFADLFINRELSIFIEWTSPGKDIGLIAFNIQHWDFFFVFAFIIGWYSIHRLALIQEIGEVEEKIVIFEFLSEIRRGLRNFSSIAGLQNMLNFPILINKLTENKKNSNSNKKNEKKL